MGGGKNPSLTFKDKIMTRNDKIVEAIQLVQEARELVKDALAGSGDLANFEAYGSYGMDSLLGEGNPYDASLHSLLEIAKLEK